MIKKLTERDHIRQRPAMYIGAVNPTKSMEYILDGGKMLYKEVESVPGLIKIINEIIDNSVDVSIKTNFKSSNQISVNMTGSDITVSDNGDGIPVQKNSDGHYLPELCWNHARAGSNFDDDENRTQIGMNGVGSYATNCFSKKFIGTTDDGKKHYVITSINGAESFKENITASKKKGTTVNFYPDLSMFGLKELDETHHQIIKQRLINLAMSFPEITFKFNKEKIVTNKFRNYLKLFSDSAVIHETEKYRFAILPNEEDDFKQFSYVNGLKIPDGGMHIDLISKYISHGLRDNLVKKYKTIKPGDIKNKLMIIAFMKDLPNPKFNSQAKEKITNSQSEINNYFGNIDYDGLIKKILKTPEIIDPITEVYKIKEELRKRQEMKSLTKKVKKIKSEKYLPATKKKKFLLITEGESALGGLIGPMGREECGFYCLKGKPLNAYAATQSKFTNNIELSELYQIVKNEDYENIIYATDQDLDGMHIRGLLNGFFHTYIPEVKGKIGVLETPVIGIKKNKKLTRWTYDLREKMTPKNGETSRYYKGLGSWKSSDLEFIIKADGLENMIDYIEWDSEEIIDDWLSTDKADKRKEYISVNNFSITKL